MEETDKKPDNERTDAADSADASEDEALSEANQSAAADTEESDIATTIVESDEPSTRLDEPAVATTVPTLEAAPARKSGAAVLLAVVALLLALAAAGGSGWMFYQGQLLEPTADLTADLNRLQNQLAALQQSAAVQQREIGENLSAQQQRLQRQLEQSTADYEQRFAALQDGQNNQRERLLEYATTDRSDWMLAESEYLLRLANQRIIMAADVRSAKALLQSADQILLELDSADLLSVRAAIAADLAALRAVPAVDVEGTWLRLQALVGQIDALRLFELPEQDALTTGPAPSGDWQQRLQQGVDSAGSKLSRYIVINRRDTPYEPMMGPQWEQLVRQNLRMLLEQSRAALLSGNQQLYQQSLTNCRFWLAEFFNQDTAGVAALDTELEALAGVTVTRSYPDISTSMMAVKTVINTRHLASGGS
ncbi:uroporphyrinogen-III C-methyltransferase [Candidatus Litorirhabdus singularis]|uniref:uroporphyrinogen-III C-methyltransferase n=1 Tax=Candidatus Litorirhabdus singularis TaxID=2518993 RepID=UPI0024307310|nr:uroporphyrinogen-III C-methyltransferase [Candidatus Litorirhabdus singularis]